MQNNDLAEQNNGPESPRILVVDDNESVRKTLSAVLRANHFLVTDAANVSQALRFIASETYDVLLCDLHMPGPGDGFTVVSAMRHTNPTAVTLVFTGFPALQEAMNAILLQADEILVKPMNVSAILAVIHAKLEKRHLRNPTSTERVASILERDGTSTIRNWLSRVQRETELTCVPLADEERTGHLPRLLQDLVQRLRNESNLGSKTVSSAAVQHGKVRQSQGYTVAMLVEESRILQVSIFETLQNNLSTVDFSLLLLDVMTIADEVDSQLKQTITSFMQQAALVSTAVVGHQLKKPRRNGAGFS